MATHRFRFSTDEDFDDGKLTLHLASMAIQGLYGEARVRLEAHSSVDRDERTICIDGDGPVGAALVRVLMKMLLEEFGEAGFTVSTLDQPADHSGQTHQSITNSQDSTRQG